MVNSATLRTVHRRLKNTERDSCLQCTSTSHKISANKKKIIESLCCDTDSGHWTKREGSLFTSVYLKVHLQMLSQFYLYGPCKPKRGWGGGRIIGVYGKPGTGRGQFKCDGTRPETKFRLSAERTSPFKSAGTSVQSTTGSWRVRISGSNAGYTMFRGSVKGTGYPLHSPFSPSIPLPCFTVCHHISVGVYPLWSV